MVKFQRASINFAATAFFVNNCLSLSTHNLPRAQTSTLGPLKSGGCTKSMNWSPSRGATSTFDSDRLTDDFILYNNIYGATKTTASSSQSVQCKSYRNGALSWTTSFNFVPSSEANKNSVKSYSNAAWAGRPRKISQLTSLRTEWNWQLKEQSKDLITNVSYDFFTSTDCNCKGQAAGCTTHEVMVWLVAIGGAAPAGTKTAGKTIKLGPKGQYEFDVWEGFVGVKVLSLIPTRAGADYRAFKADLLPGLKALQSLGLSSQECIVSLGAGPEPFKGKAKLDTQKYTFQFA